MHRLEDFTFPAHPHRVSRVLFAAALGISLLTGSAPASAQAKPTGPQLDTMLQCLVGCARGDASCQTSCIKTPPSPAYSTCVKTCADSSAAPGQQQSQAADLKICVQACN